MAERPTSAVGELQNDVEVLLCMRLNDEDLFMPGHPMEERLRWAIPTAALMRVKPTHLEAAARGSSACSYCGAEHGDLDPCNLPENGSRVGDYCECCDPDTVWCLNRKDSEKEVSDD